MAEQGVFLDNFPGITPEEKATLDVDGFTGEVIDADDRSDVPGEGLSQPPTPDYQALKAQLEGAGLPVDPDAVRTIKAHKQARRVAEKVAQEAATEKRKRINALRDLPHQIHAQGVIEQLRMALDAKDDSTRLEHYRKMQEHAQFAVGGLSQEIRTASHTDEEGVQAAEHYRAVQSLPFSADDSFGI